MANDKNTFDAIVIGSGMSGGWAAKELCEKGFKTLVLERGRNVEHIKDYPTATKMFTSVLVYYANFNNIIMLPTSSLASLTTLEYTDIKCNSRVQLNCNR